MARVLSTEEIERLEQGEPAWERRAWVRKLGASWWVKLPLEVDGARDPDWDAYYRFVPQDGNPVLAEVRLLPRPRKQADDRALLKSLRSVEGSARARGEPTAKALRSISATKAHYYLRVHAGMEKPTAEVFAAFARSVLEQDHRPDRKGAGHPPEWWAAWAQMYVDAARERRDAIAAIRERLPQYTREYVRDQVFNAREKGYLQTVGQGRVGGALTEKARRVLREST
jgi:hypothetical protein